MAGHQPHSRLAKIYDALEEKAELATVLWELTYRCNLSCRHCYLDEHNSSELTLQEIISALDDLADAGVLTLIFTGGEIFLRDDILDVLQAAREREFAFRLLTSGTLITEQIAREIARLTPTEVDLSIYGQEATHDYITKIDGSWKKTIRAAKLLTAHDITVRLKMPIMQSNMQDFQYVKNLATELNCPLVYDTDLVCKSSGDPTPLKEQMTEDATLEFMRTLRDLTTNISPPMKPQMSDDAPFCSAGITGARIMPTGEVTPCIAIPTSLGNIRDMSIREIWNCEELKSLREIRLRDLPKCKNCDNLIYCFRCPGQALTEDGDILGLSTAACRTARIARKFFEST